VVSMLAAIIFYGEGALYLPHLWFFSRFPIYNKIQITKIWKKLSVLCTAYKAMLAIHKHVIARLNLFRQYFLQITYCRN